MRLIRDRGFSPDLIGTIAGASGGAKWLVLSQLDRVIADRILPRLSAPVHLVGSSIGAWRFACYGQADPLAAIERFEAAYLEQRYGPAPDASEISAKSREILDEILGGGGAAEIVSHPVLRMHVLTVRARHLASSERPLLLAAALAAAATGNALSRKSLGLWFVRSLFFDPRDRPPFFDVRGFPLEKTPLSAVNLPDAILASGAIPLVLNGVRDIDGAPRGMYRDGGVIDYHLDLPTSPVDRLTLYPHFFDALVPGWFDKRLQWRKTDPVNFDRTLLVTPTPEFIAGLPGGKIPDRSDFRTMSPELRRKVWRSAVARCRQLADEFLEVLDGGRLADRLLPL